MILDEAIAKLEDNSTHALICENGELTAWLKELRELKAQTPFFGVYIPKSDVLDLITELHESGGFTSYSDYSSLRDSVDNMPAANVVERICPMTFYPTDCTTDCFTCDCGGEAATDDLYVHLHNIQRVCTIMARTWDSDEEEENICHIIKRNLESMAVPKPTEGGATDE